MKYSYLLIFIIVVSCGTNQKETGEHAEEKTIYTILKSDLEIQVARHFAVNDSLHIVDPDKTQDTTLQAILDRYKPGIFNQVDSIDRLTILKSEDKKLCLISWNTGMGGTMIDFASMAIYKTNAGIYVTKMLVETDNSGETFNRKMLYRKLYAVSATTGEVYYLAHGVGQGSTALPWEEVRAFQLKDDQVKDAAIFPKNLPNIFIEFDTHQFKDHESVPNITIEDQGRKIRVPKPDENEGFSGNWMNLVFDGRSFTDQ